MQDIVRNVRTNSFFSFPCYLSIYPQASDRESDDLRECSPDDS
uniref:Uncharacterized protein n=1 Tax=Rhizophora mucronata TaxID=61149 RepID=A0A2P2PAI1_RHIMU